MITARVRSPSINRRRAVTNDVGAMLKSPGGGGEGEEGNSIPAGVSALCACDYASDIACANVIVCVIIDPLVVSSDCTDCDKIDGDGGVSSSCCCCCCES